MRDRDKVNPSFLFFQIFSGAMVKLGLAAAAY